MKKFSDYLVEGYGKGGLTIFDIDDTLFHTTAKIAVVKDGKKIRDLTNQEFNTYKLKAGEKYDFGQFKDAQKFRSESKPVQKMFAKAKAILSNVVNKGGSRVIILTARDDFDDRETFLNTFRDHGFDIDKVRVERAGKIKDMMPEHSKYIIIYNYLKQGLYSRVRLFDDSKANLKQFLRLSKEFPDISFEAYFVDDKGNARKVGNIKESVEQDILSEASYEGNIGMMEIFKFHRTATPEQKKKLKDHIANKRTKEAWKLVQHVTGVKLHKSVYEEIDPDILPKSGAGQQGTDELRKTYQRMTPGQFVTPFTDYIKKKK